MPRPLRPLLLPAGVCSGWGDPHYITFDGTYYTFLDNCTYVLVQQIVPVYGHFRVLIDNYFCGSQDGLSCPQSIVVEYRRERVVLTRKPVRGVMTNEVGHRPWVGGESWATANEMGSGARDGRGEGETANEVGPGDGWAGRGWMGAMANEAGPRAGWAGRAGRWPMRRARGRVGGAAADAGPPGSPRVARFRSSSTTKWSAPASRKAASSCPKWASRCT